jgi:putative transcriptional regulator
MSGRGPVNSDDDPQAIGQAQIEAIEEAARSDADNPPLDELSLSLLQAVPRVKVIRRALGLTQEEFAGRYLIPLGTLRDWEQGRTAPDQAARAYLKVIAEAPDTVSRALGTRDAA